MTPQTTASAEALPPTPDNYISIVTPAKNEALGLDRLLKQLKAIDGVLEIIVVNDGSTDTTLQIAHDNNITVISHPYSKGNGAAIKTGAQSARGSVLLFMDADNQHNPKDIQRLIERLSEGYDMVVGARQHGSQASSGRSIANRIYNWLASYMTGHKIEDLTSGFRAVRTEKFREFLHLLPNGFSYPTTITMAFFRAGYSVAYEPIHASRRLGKSHIQPLKDGVRFLLIIFKIGTLYSPLKLFAPIALLHFLIGIAYYLFTYLTQERLSSMTIFMLTTAVIIFLIGLVSEQITQLAYRPLHNLHNQNCDNNQCKKN